MENHTGQLLILLGFLHLKILCLSKFGGTPHFLFRKKKQKAGLSL